MGVFLIFYEEKRNGKLSQLEIIKNRARTLFSSLDTKTSNSRIKGKEKPPKRHETGFLKNIQSICIRIYVRWNGGGKPVFGG